MNVVVTHEQRFERLPDGTVWTTSPLHRSFWQQRYLEVFDAVRVLARVRDVESVGDGARRVDGGGVAFPPLPYYVGPAQYARSFVAVRSAVAATLDGNDAAVLRVPSQIGFHAYRILRRRGQPYAVEVVGDPHEVFSSGAVRHPLRIFFRWQFTRTLRLQCLHASAAAYTTEQVLQRRYPTNGSVAAIFHLPLSDEFYVPSPRTHRDRGGPFRIVSVGSLDQMYKGVDILIDAAAQCVARGADLEVIVVGGGRYEAALRGRAESAGIGRRVHFIGSVPAGPAVRDQLDGADLFVLASRSEGSPAAIVEAMAQALPCLSTAVGGIVELLAAEDLVRPEDPDALAAQIADVASDADRWVRMSARNLERAREFHVEVQQPRWNSFYQSLRAVTERWSSTGVGGC